MLKERSDNPRILRNNPHLALACCRSHQGRSELSRNIQYKRLACYLCLHPQSTPFHLGKCKRKQLSIQHQHLLLLLSTTWSLIPFTRPCRLLSSAYPHRQPTLVLPKPRTLAGHFLQYSLKKLYTLSFL